MEREPMSDERLMQIRRDAYDTAPTCRELIDEVDRLRAELAAQRDHLQLVLDERNAALKARDESAVAIEVLDAAQREVPYVSRDHSNRVALRRVVEICERVIRSNKVPAS